MRMVLVLVALVLLVGAGLLMTGMVSIDQTRPGVVRAPQFHADVGRVTLGTEKKVVDVPKVSVEKADNAAASAR